MSSPSCRICHREPAIGVDKSCAMVHSLSGLRAIKHTKNRELQRATEQLEKKRRHMHANKADEMASLGQLQQQLRDINNKKDRMEKCIHSVKNCLEQHKTKNLILQKEIVALETERRDAENLNSIIQSNCAVLSRNFEGNLKNAIAARRYKAVLDIFISFPIISIAGTDHNDGGGYSTISGIPLPNSGIYGGLPDEIIRSALGFVTHLVDMIGVTLNISLPHPLLPFANAAYAAVGLLSNGNMQYLPLTPLISSVAKDERVDNPDFDLAHDMLSANITYICLTLKVQPDQIYPTRCLLLNLQLLHTICLSRAEELMPYMSANLSRSAMDSRNDLEYADATELVHALIQRYRSLETHSVRDAYFNSSSNDRGGEQDWLLVDSDMI